MNMQRDKKKFGMVGLVFLMLHLAGCSSAEVSTPPDLPCAEPYVMPEASPEEYAWVMTALENIEPGVTDVDDVLLLLGEPTGATEWTYDPDVGFPLWLDFYDNNIVEVFILDYPMTLGQLIETYGLPSRVYRSTRPYNVGFPGEGPWGATLLFYDDENLVALILQGICEFLPGTPIASISVFEAIPYDGILSDDAVEVEWPGLGAAREVEWECNPPQQVLTEFPPGQYEWVATVLENIQPGVTHSDEVLRLLDEPTSTTDYHWGQQWGYNPDVGYVSLLVSIDRDDIVQDIFVYYPLTVGQLVDLYGEPSRVYRDDEIAASYEFPEGSRGITYLFYDDVRLAAYVLQGICEFPSELLLEALYVSTALPDRFLSFKAVEIEWPGLTTE